ncbi:hypothetical protein J6590_091552 [Homalodisca vitripennis]|nr:hypothetical protein J6590_091552 [Homalodisca vitripennis]
MEFMLAGMSHRTGETNVSPLDDDNIQINNVEVNIDEELIDQGDNEENFGLPEDGQECSEATTSANSRHRPPRGADKIFNFLKSKEQRKRSAPVADELDLFFASVCKTTRRLPRHLQIRIKRQVINTITEAEEEYELLNSLDSPSLLLTPSPVAISCASTDNGMRDSPSSTSQASSNIYYCLETEQQYQAL